MPADPMPEDMEPTLHIRPERPGDEGAIAALTTAAFADAPHSDGTEADIVDRLRKAGALSLSLVAVEAPEDGTAPRILGHVAFSPVRIGGVDHGWTGLGPVSVAPDRQGAGIGAALIREGLLHMRAAGSRGCVLLGDPAYYRRFGFACHPGLILPEVPPEYFMALPWDTPTPQGEVAYHPAFSG